MFSDLSLPGYGSVRFSSHMKTEKVNQAGLSWKPRRSGLVYCAPACGAGCTWEAYQKAVSDAGLVASLLGRNWKPVVSENCHWYWSVQLDSGEGVILRVSPTEHKGKVTYSTLLGPGGGGETMFYTTRDFKNPRDAVRFQMKLFRAYVYKRDVQLSSIELLLKNND